MPEDAYAMFASADSKEAANFARLLSEVRVIYENATKNLGRILNPDPNKEYVWAHKDPAAMAKRTSMGFEVVRDDKKKADSQPTVSTQWRQPDGSYRRGDVVLMSIEKERYRALKLYPELLAIQNLRNVKLPLLEQARQAGIRVETLEGDGASMSQGE